jgi:hypothetical protein
MQTSAPLREIQQLKYDLSEAAAARKLELLTELSGRSLRTADEVVDLHESLCYLRAYPPNAEVRDLVGRMLGSFEQRKDLRRFAKALANTGIAGTRIDFRFYWLTAIWVAEQGWARHLKVEWKEFENKNKLSDLLHLLLPFSETPRRVPHQALRVNEDRHPDAREALRGPRHPDATRTGRDDTGARPGRMVGCADRLPEEPARRTASRHEGRHPEGRLHCEAAQPARRSSPDRSRQQLHGPAPPRPAHLPVRGSERRAPGRFRGRVAVPLRWRGASRW